MVTGLSVSGGQTRPGAAASLSIRQPMTLSKDGGDTNPIYVVDDFIVDATTFNNLDPSEVENISVLKDAAASVLWCSWWTRCHIGENQAWQRR